MATNQLLPFASGESPNVIPFNDWNSLPARLTGFKSGIASSQQFNYILAQGGVAGYILGQLIVDKLNQDATLDPDTLYQNIVNALKENAKDACLALSGGTMKGTIKQTTQFALSRATDDTRLEISGGTSATDGASLYLDGVNRINEPGVFSLIARDNNGNIKQLRGEPNGSLTWGGKNVVRSINGTNADVNGNVAISIQKFAPDYDAIVSISSFPYTAPTNGYIRFGVQGNQYGGVSVNGSTNNNTYFQIAGGSFDEMSIIPVSEGDVIYSHNNNKGRFFIPCKGA